MNATDYQRAAERTLIDAPGFDISDRDMMLLWSVIGLAGETGELAEHVKKGVLHQHGLDVAAVRKEAGDVLWYLAAICTKLDIDLGDVMADNIAKLQVRYPNGFSSADSVQRRDTR